MQNIYCLFTVGGSLTDEISTILMTSAQDIIRKKQRKIRLNQKEIKLTGEVTTSYKVGFMGSIVGIVCNASIDWDGGSVKTDFIVKPTKDPNEILGGRWVKAPLFPIEALDPALN